MRFVPVKSSEQLAVQAVHRICQRLVSERTRLANQVHGLLAEHGIVIARDITRLRHALVQIVDGAEPGLNDLLRDLYSGKFDALRAIVLRDIYELIEKNVDRCRDVGNVVMHIVLKNS